MLKLKVAILSLLFPFMLIIGMLIHENSHAITAIILGNEVEKIIFTYGERFVDWTFQVHYIMIIPESRPYIAIAGSLGSIIFAIPQIIIGYKKSSNFFLINGSVFFMAEFFYWGISPFIKYGDAYHLYWSIGFENFIPLSVTFFSVCAISFIIFISKIADNYLDFVEDCKYERLVKFTEKITRMVSPV